MAEYKSGLTLRGVLFEDGPEALTLKIGDSLFEIMRAYVQETREIEETAEGRVVEVKVAANAHIIQRVLASASTLVSARLPVLAAACDCACNCNCACECACGGGKREFQAETGAFRSRMREDAVGEFAA